MTRSQPALPTRYLDLLFFVGFALLACHELDAVAQAEWRLLPFLSQMGDEDAYTVFVFLHVPLFALLMWWTSSTSALVRFRAQLSVDAFMVIHVGLHMLFRSHADYRSLHDSVASIPTWEACFPPAVKHPRSRRSLFRVGACKFLGESDKDREHEAVLGPSRFRLDVDQGR